MGKSQKGLSQGQQLALGVAEKLLAPEILARIDVSKSTLAKVAGQSRPTFYRHLKAMGLGEEAQPMSLEDRTEYIRAHFTVKAVEDLKDYALEQAFYRKKTQHRAYDNSQRAAKAQTLRQSRAKQTKKQTVDQARANTAVLAEVSALTGQKTAPAPAKTVAKESLPFDPYNKIPAVVAPVTRHLMKIATHYYFRNVVKKPLTEKRQQELYQSPTCIAAMVELKSLANDPKNKIDLESWAIWYYVENFINTKQRELIARSLRIGHYNDAPDNGWTHELYLACKNHGITPEIL